MHLKLILAALILPTLFTAARADDAYTVTVTGGRIHGKARKHGALFAGIPYARPPVGEGRWRPPQPVEPWNGVREATEPGPSSLQPDLGWNKTQRARQSEDCLYLNVLTSEWPSTGRLPVIVYIHGGANVGGAGWDHLLEHTTLPEHGVVLVSLNYRLGVFGFLAHPELTAESPHHASGNYGLMDQMAAIRWVRENIARFGGDPDNLTVMGQSAGAQDIGLIVASPQGRGLFSRAILESGPVTGIGFSRYRVLAEAEQMGAEFAKMAGQPDLAALRRMAAGDVIDAAARAHLSFGPDVDGWVLADRPGKIYATGRTAPVAMIVGSNAREFTFEGKPEELRSQIERAFGELAPEALRLYGLADGAPAPEADPVPGDAGTQFVTDLAFRGPSSLVAIWQHEAGNPVWRYQFSRTPIGHEKQGASHSAELPFVFGEMVPNELGDDYDAADRKLCETIQRYWVNFATTGDPNATDVPPWPHFDPDARRYLDFTAGGPEVRTGLRREIIDLMRKRYEQQNALVRRR